jgi:hypothetical protein
VIVPEFKCPNVSDLFGHIMVYVDFKASRLCFTAEENILSNDGALRVGSVPK